ncbi:hypothetical protein HYV49_05995 [Candidatus Pacearchaeota archaeon]|nr:hypothetical protein [Candidatus Pacearchaeota archaeon]
MAWKKINKFVRMWDKPVLGNVNQKNPIMALAILKEKINEKYQGIAREIIERKGDVAISGFVDKSRLVIVESTDLLSWNVKEKLKIKGIKNIIKKYEKENTEFVGLEDPDINVSNGIIHVYFTIAYKFLNIKGFAVYLGHAQGKSLADLKATEPVLSPMIQKNRVSLGFKEESDFPIKYKTGRIKLVESNCGLGDSIIVAAISKNGKKWKLLGMEADPHKMKQEWCHGDLSPGPILKPSFIRHRNLLVGFVNGRSPSKIIDGKKVYGKFKVGLMLVNPQTGEIPWISPEPLIDDPDARTITFASDFLQLDDENGILYAHVDDSFVRAYEISTDGLNKFLKKHLKN